MWNGLSVRKWMAALDATCAWVNPGFVLVAIAIALLDLTIAAQRWAVVSPASPVPVSVVVAPGVAENYSPALTPELRDMAGRD